MFLSWLAGGMYIDISGVFGLSQTSFFHPLRGPLWPTINVFSYFVPAKTRLGGPPKKHIKKRYENFWNMYSICIESVYAFTHTKNYQKPLRIFLFLCKNHILYLVVHYTLFRFQPETLSSKSSLNLDLASSSSRRVYRPNVCSIILKVCYAKS